MKYPFSIIKNSWFWIIISLVWMWFASRLFFAHTKFSIQFTWWAQIVASWVQKIDMLDTTLKNTFGTYAVYQREWNDITILIQTGITSTWVSSLWQQLTTALVANQHITSSQQIIQISTVWPTIWEYITSTAIQAIIWWLIAMVIYMIFAFKAIRFYIQPWILAVITAFTMLFDVISPMWVYGIMTIINPTTQVDVIFIVALLTTMWYSINDTIIIFDRIRENFIQAKWKVDAGQIFDMSLWQTMRRSLGTSFATLLVVIAMYIFGTWDLWRFAFTMIFGVISWSFSSIFVAAPLAYVMMKKKFE